MLLGAKTLIWSFLFGLGALVSLSYQPYIVDPADDFSFSFRPVAEAQVVRSMSEDRILRVLQDHLPSDELGRAPEIAVKIKNLSSQYHFHPAFLLALMRVESAFRPRAISPVGAMGLMQLMPDTARWISTQIGEEFRGEAALFDPVYNLQLGIWYLAFLRDRYAGYPAHYIAAYNMGPQRLDEILSRGPLRPVKSRAYHFLIRDLFVTFKAYLGDTNAI